MEGFRRGTVILKNVFIAYFITLLLFLVYSLLLEFTPIPESSIQLFGFISCTLAVIKIRENGLINGGLVGLIYILVLYFLSSIFSTGFGLNGYAFSMIIFNIIIGMIGGIIGVNMCKEGK